MRQAKIKFVHSDDKNKYRKPKDLENVIIYILNPEKRCLSGDNIYGRFGCLAKDYKGIIGEFMETKRIFHQTSGLQLKHIVITFGHRPDVSTRKMKRLVRKTVSFFGKNHQCVYAVHENKPEDYHIHICVNSVSNYGKKIDIRMKDLIDFKKKFNRIWKNYDCCMDLKWNSH